ncbi:hypothetical protein EA462_13345 [Natrarchaeobius halalkaliphilus]|uniref:Uncharacterized protein n=1 Tax=Natrarchaeobius halalkaliphilus TaxID=1679091 RepID=A0A3N6LIR7_9EURY|nr:hypothetical protein EA462_13345 [Natrarchaeobius halalkaliphilus]
MEYYVGHLPKTLLLSLVIIQRWFRTRTTRGNNGLSAVNGVLESTVFEMRNRSERPRVSRHGTNARAT